MGLTGAGGGILSVPLLVFALHLPVAQVVPISLCAIALAAGVAHYWDLEIRFSAIKQRA